MINRDLTNEEIDELVGLAYANVNSSASPCDVRIADLCGAAIAELRRRRAAMASSAIESLAKDFRAWCVQNDYQDKVTDGDLRVNYLDGQVEIALGCHALGDGRWFQFSFPSEAAAIEAVRRLMADNGK